MIRLSFAIAAFAACGLWPVGPAQAATGASAPAHSTARKPAAKPAVAAAEPESAPDDELNPVQLTLADRVLTGLADCELKQKVEVQKVEGHSGNFKIVFDKHTYIVQPRETTTGAIVLVDKAGTIEWLQIPRKSMLMNIKLHQRLVDDCQQDEQRIATRAAAQAAANAPMLAPSVAGSAPAPAIAASAAPGAASVPTTPAAPAAPAAPTASAPIKTSLVTTRPSGPTVRIVPPEPVERAGLPPDAAASGMFR